MTCSASSEIPTGWRDGARARGGTMLQISQKENKNKRGNGKGRNDAADFACGAASLSSGLLGLTFVNLICLAASPTVFRRVE